VKSLRARLTLWYGLGFVVVSAAFIFLLHLTLEKQLLQKACNKVYPELPDWKLHDSLTEAEVHQISDALLKSALLWLIPVVVLAVAGGYWLARQSLRPIASVNRQLQAKNPGNLAEPISLPELDDEFRDLVRQLNELLVRLDDSFNEMNNYAAKVAHELRTPLAILRLKVEQAGERIAPELADELESELHRLTHVVDQSLLIARAEQGRLMAMRSVFNLSAAVAEVVEDFQLLAAEQDRQFTLKSVPECWVSADPRHVRQITHTLLTNALKHGGGDLTVRVKPSGKFAAVTVSNLDTGNSFHGGQIHEALLFQSFGTGS
jgi:signal transduction histidine kinase